MSALLAEYRTASVRQLSAGLPPPGKPNEPDPEDLPRRIVAAIGRPLDAMERESLHRIHVVYLRCRRTRRLTPSDVQQMGFYLPPSAGSLEVWPEFPETEHEFWLYVAHALQENSQNIPDFLLPITDLEPIRQKFAQALRVEKIQYWNLALSGPALAPTVPSAGQLIELRLAITESEAALQWKRPGMPEFKRLRHTPARELSEQVEEGLARLTPEGELLWSYFGTCLLHSRDIEWRYLDRQVRKGLNRALRLPVLENHIVDWEGRPLRRVAEPLRWELAAAGGEEEDYRLRLVQADGRTVPLLLCALDGDPAVYLTPAAVFNGPPLLPNLLDPAAENSIPAPAFESPDGVRLLQRLGLELPPRIRERVRHLRYEVVISCALRPRFDGKSEDCVFTVGAEAPDGRRQVWTGSHWVETSHKPRGAQLTMYDASALEQVPALLAPLRLKTGRFDEELALRVTRSFPDAFASWLKNVPRQITVQLKGELASFGDTDVVGKVKLDVTEVEIDWFDLRVVLDVADTTLTKGEIKLLLNAKGRYVRLEGKGWRRLRYDLGGEENERLARLGLNASELSAEPQRLHALQLADEAARKFLPEQAVEQIQRRAGEIKARVTPELPAGVTAQFRPYQVEGFHFLAYLATNRFGGILADDMGLGKTVQALAWLVWLQERQRAAGGGAAIEPALVVCPKSVMDNWHAEAARFTPGLRVRAWFSGELERFVGELASADLHVVNYAQLRLLGEAVSPVRWLAVILDEGQYIKNPDSQTAQVARSLRAVHRLVLSGTPIENRLLDLWSLMAFTMPGVLGSRAQFMRIYNAKDDPFGRRRLASRVRPFLLRRTKGQVARDLPDRIEEDLFCEMDGEQQALYRAELKRAQQLLLGIKTQKELAEHQFHFLTALLRLRQICCHPRLMKTDSTGASAKTEALLEQLEPLMEEGQKVLVFSQFVEMLTLLRPVLEERGWRLFYLDGSTENRGELVQNFQSAPGAGIFLISLKAGGFGLNLTAASYVVLFDPWWNPAVEMQAIDRTHRIGQTETVNAYRLLIKNSIEEKIRALQKQKRALAEDVLGEEKFAQSLTLEDLRFLFAD
jgi:hypothetical protein